MKRILSRLAALLPLAATTGCILQIKGSGSWEPKSHGVTHWTDDSSQPRLRGSGISAREERATAPFDSVRVSDQFEVEIAVGSDTSVEVQADDNLIDRIQTEVHGDTLAIEMLPGSYSFGDTPRVRITTPALEELELDGSTTVDLSGLAGDDLAIFVNAAGVVRGSGTLDDLYVEINGTASLELFDLVANEVEIEINGTGTVSVHALDRLEAHINGTGALVYRGQPETAFDVNGAGHISAE